MSEKIYFIYRNIDYEIRVEEFRYPSEIRGAEKRLVELDNKTRDTQIADLKIIIGKEVGYKLKEIAIKVVID